MVVVVLYRSIVRCKVGWIKNVNDFVLRTGFHFHIRSCDFEKG